MTDNTDIARRFVERVLGAGDMAAFDAIVADDIVVDTGLHPGGAIRGKAAYGEVLGTTVGAAFDGGTMQVDEVIAAGPDRVVVRFTATARHSAPLWGVAATGRTVTFREIHLMRFRDGKLVENLVGGMNPLEFEMIFREPIAREVLGADA